MMGELERGDLVVPVRIPVDLAGKLDRAVRLLRYRSRNEFIREAISRHVEEKASAKIIAVRDVPVQEAVRMIDAYLSKKPGAHFVSEIAEELGIELDAAFKAAERLLERGSAVVRRR